MFEVPPNKHSRLRVRFSSMDNTSDVCAIVSIQKSYVSKEVDLVCIWGSYVCLLTQWFYPCIILQCPENLGKSDHHGEFQTVLSQAAINVQVGMIASTTVCDWRSPVITFVPCRCLIQPTKQIYYKLVIFSSILWFPSLAVMNPACPSWELQACRPQTKGLN